MSAVTELYPGLHAFLATPEGTTVTHEERDRMIQEHTRLAHGFPGYSETEDCWLRMLMLARCFCVPDRDAYLQRDRAWSAAFGGIKAAKSAWEGLPDAWKLRGPKRADAIAAVRRDIELARASLDALEAMLPMEHASKPKKRRGGR